MSSSSNTTILTRESLDSNSGNGLSRGTRTKRQRSNHEAHPARYKGVVTQQNRNWGAQIYFNNERIWLGTFRSEKEAAMAYDSAALKLRNNDCSRNFPWTSLTIHEPRFQQQFSTEAVLNMIKDGSYPSKLTDYVNSLGNTVIQTPQEDTREGYSGKILFRKELTPSDVGKLNRLVIPKKAAVRFFPAVPAGGQEVELTFHDQSMRVWKFRYCYWKSSQSFVFTRGWNRFVSTNNLRSRDVLTFLTSERREESTNEVSVSHVIEVTHANQEEPVESSDVGEPAESVGVSGVEGKNGNSLMGEKEDGSVDEEKKGFKLFGVQIFEKI